MLGREWSSKLGTPTCGLLPLSTKPLYPQDGGRLPITVMDRRQRWAASDEKGKPRPLGCP